MDQTQQTQLNNQAIDLDCIRSEIVDFLQYQLENDLITQKRAAQLAQAALDQLVDGLSRQQAFEVIKKMQQDFPEELSNLEAATAECETKDARKTIDAQVLTKITQGNVDEAMNLLNSFTIK